MTEETNSITGSTLSAGAVISIARDVLRRWVLILSVVLVAVMGTYVYQDMTYTPHYTTTTTFVATSSSTSSTVYQNLSAATNLASVFTEVLNSSLLREEVLRQEGIADFDGTISASAIPDTNLLTMTVSGSDPRSVFLMSQAIIEHHHVVSEQILGATVLEVLQDPKVPVYPINPLNLRRSVRQAALVAAAAIVALLAYFSFRSDRIRSREEADRNLRCRVLGLLRHERKPRAFRGFLRRNRSALLITNPTVSFLYTEAVNKLSSRVEKRLGPGKNVLMVTSLLENEGKSTVAANLALSMSRKGKKVLLLDCDLRKPACSLLLKLPQNSPGISGVLSGKAALNEAVQQVKHTGLHVLSGFRGMPTASDLSTSRGLANLLQQASQMYDIVVVDTPPMSLAPDAEGISGFAHASLLVIKQNEAPAKALNKAIDVLEKSHARLLGCVLNNVYGSGSFSPAYTGSYSKYGRYDKYGKYGKYGYGYGYGYGRGNTASRKEEQN